jgi:hypothetical protein
MDIVLGAFLDNIAVHIVLVFALVVAFPYAKTAAPVLRVSYY